MSASEFVLSVLRIVLIDFPKIAAWPIVVVCVARYFRAEIGSFIGRITEVGFKGAKAVPPQTQSVPEPKPLGEGSKANTSALPSSKAIQTRTEFLRGEVQRLQWDKKSPEELQALLLREVAVFQLRELFATVMGVIYGSQLELLQAINNRGSVSYEEAKVYYAKFVKLYGEKSVEVPTFETWIAFLQNTNLITVDAGTYRLTDQGVDFISGYAPAMNLKPSDRLW